MDLVCVLFSQTSLSGAPPIQTHTQVLVDGSSCQGIKMRNNLKKNCWSKKTRKKIDPWTQRLNCLESLEALSESV